MPVISADFSVEPSKFILQELANMVNQTYRQNEQNFAHFFNLYGSHFFTSAVFGSKFFLRFKLSFEMLARHLVSDIARKILVQLRKLFGENGLDKSPKDDILIEFGGSCWGAIPYCSTYKYQKKVNYGLRGFVLDSQYGAVILAGNTSRISTLIPGLSKESVKARQQMDLAIDQRLYQSELNRLEKMLFSKFYELGYERIIEKALIQITEAKKQKNLTRMAINKLKIDVEQILEKIKETTSLFFTRKLEKIKMTVIDQLEDMIRGYYAVYGWPTG